MTKPGMETQTKTAVHWFRKGLRVHDNPALYKICDIARNGTKKSAQKYSIRPIFILDPGIIGWMKVGANRWRFLQQSLQQLHENLCKINSRLYVVRGNPVDVFPLLIRRWNITVLSFETDIEPYARKRDVEIVRLAKAHGVQVLEECSHTVFNPEVVLQRNLGKPIIQYQKFLSLTEKLAIPKALDPPAALLNDTIPVHDEEEVTNAHCYDPPLMEELVKHPEDLGPLKFPGGETEAVHRMNTSLSDTAWVCSFEKPNTSPNSLEPSTTVLSPYLKFGCLSSRLLHERLTGILNKNPKHSKPPVSLMGQLMWREFYYAAGSAEPYFDRMMGNSICYQIPWRSNDTHLDAWTHGRTGYPFIDAIMRQLRQEGWIHHLARHAVACFLTRGDLWISWEEGQKVFEELLLDADWALNAGNWMWLSASAFFYQYFRVYSPVAFGKKTDPTGSYIRKYVPELAKYPNVCIYEPWKATLSSQREYGCVLGKDYPYRIVNHETIHKENIRKMTAAYKVNREVRTGKVEDLVDHAEMVGKRPAKKNVAGNAAKRAKRK